MQDLNSVATIGQALQKAAIDRGGATGWIANDQPISWTEMNASTRRLACGFLRAGFRLGDRIGIIALNQVEWLQIFFAATRIGLVVVGMSVRYRDNELNFMVHDSRVKALFTLSAHAGFSFSDMLRRLAEQMPSLEHVIGLDRQYDGESLNFEALIATPVDEDALHRAELAVTSADLAMVIYTSGTTGRPKGAGLTHASLLASAGSQARHTRITGGDLQQLSLPFNHVGGITCGILTFLIGGGTVELVPEFRPDVVIDMMTTHPPTVIGAVPTMLTLLLMHPRFASVNLDNLRLIVSGGANLDAPLINRLRQRVPHATLMNLYGLSESSGAIVMTPWNCSEADLLTPVGTRFADAEVKVVDPMGQILATNSVGELCFRGCGVIPGYVGLTVDAGGFDAQGWLHTGDLGSVDERGYITLKGRAKDMYVQGGFNVYPVEIENFIAQHPKVLLVAGIGVPDPVLGEVGRFYIIPRPGSALEDQEILDWCRASLADYKVPRQVVLRESLPLTPAGKIQKSALRDER